MWLQSEKMPEDARPDKSGVVLFIAGDQDIVQAKVEPSKPDAWDRGIMKKLLSYLTNNGYDVVLSIGDRRKYLTVNENTAKAVRNKLIQLRGND